MAALGGAGALSAAYLACRREGLVATVAPGESPAAGVSSVLADYRSRFHYSKLKDLSGQKEGPKYGGTFRFSHYLGFTGAWDITGPEADALASFAPNHFNGLVTFRQDDFSNVHNLYEVIGDLAQRWETPDQLTVTSASLRVRASTTSLQSTAAK